MHQHGSGEIASSKHARNVLQMASDLRDARGVLPVIRAHLDKPAIVSEQEIMCSFLMRESHNMIAMGVHGSMMVRVLGTAHKTENEKSSNYGEYGHTYLYVRAPIP
jgi:hypothetical protein